MTGGVHPSHLKRCRARTDAYVFRYGTEVDSCMGRGQQGLLRLDIMRQFQLLRHADRGACGS